METREMRPNVPIIPASEVGEVEVISDARRLSQMADGRINGDLPLVYELRVGVVRKSAVLDEVLEVAV